MELVAHSENQLMHRVAQVVRLEHAEIDRRGAEVPEGDGHVLMQKAGSNTADCEEECDSV